MWPLNYLFSEYNRARVVDQYTYQQLFAAYERVYKPGSKTAVFYHRDLYLTMKAMLNKTEPPKLLETRLQLESRALIFSSHHFLFDIFDRKLQQYFEGGLINQNTKLWHHTRSPKKFKKFRESFAVLTFGELEAGFFVCVVPFILCIFVFVIEWMPSLKDLILFLLIFKKYFEVKETEQRIHNELVEKMLGAYRRKQQCY